MKTCKKLLALLAVFSLALAMMPVLPANAAEEEMLDLSWTDPENEEMTVLEADELTDLEKETLVQIPAIKASEALGEYFLSIGYAEDEIPECYGGAYINDEHQLVIKITAGYQAICDDIRDIMPSDASFIIEETDISLLELMSIQNNVTSIHRNGISASGISQKDSMINIGITPEYAKVIGQLPSANQTNMFDHVRFYVDVDVPHFNTSLIGGNALYREVIKDKKPILEFAGTLGFCGTFKINGKIHPCILTAGHLVEGYDIYYATGNPSGNNSENSTIHFIDGKQGDYALIPIGTGNSSTNLVRVSQNTTAKITSSYNGIPITDLFQDREVIKYGVTTGLTAGTIQEINTSRGYNGKTILGLVSFFNKSTTICAPGDSGGPVWFLDENGSRESRGIISAVYTDDTRVGYFTRLEFPCTNDSYLPKLY